jgi:hypothetical protein
MNSVSASARKEGDNRGVRKAGRFPAKTMAGSATLCMGTVNVDGIKEITHPIKVVNGSASRKI